MNDEIPLNLAVEDPLSDAVLREILKQSSRNFAVGTTYCKGGNVYLRKSIKAFNNAAKGTPFLVLTDLDQAVCAPVLINEWLPSRNHNLIFRVAVREVESWLLAHGKAIAKFLGIKNDLIPKDVESVDNPKQLLINLARSSNKRVLKESIVPKPNSTAKVGPDYNGCLISFVNQYWKVNEAIVNSPSLNKTIVALEEFRPKFG